MTTSGRGGGLQYRAEIDGLRAIAVLLVVVFHAFPAALPGGFVGVDVFFVISGYLISSIILKDLANGTYTLIGFYARRFRRIVPALLVVLVTTWLLGCLLMLGDELSNLGRHLLAGSTFTSNVLLRFESGYFDVSAAFKPLLHLWSLGVEEQFYLIWPLLLMLALRWRMNFALLVLALLIASFALNVTLIGQHPTPTFYFIHTRFWELLLGCGLAGLEVVDERHLGKFAAHPFARHFRPGAPSRHAWLPDAKAAAGIAMLVISAALLNESKPFPGWWAALPTVAAVLLISAGPASWLNRSILSCRPMVFIGLISYPLYLWHWPLLSLAAIMAEGTPPAGVRVGAVLLSVALAYLTWRLVELPAQRKLFKSAPPARKAWLYAGWGIASLAAVGLLGILTMYEHGFESRYPAREAIAAQMKWSTNGATRCRQQYKTDGICWATSQHPRIAVWGESHAEMLLPGLAITPSLASSSMVLIGNYGCPPLLDVEVFNGSVSQGCREKTNEIGQRISQYMSGVEVVILASRGPVYFSGEGFGKENTEHEPVPTLVVQDGKPRTQREIFLEGYSRTISFLESQGKTVVFFIDVPELGFQPAECVDVRPVRFSPKRIRTPCGVPAEIVRQRQAEYRAIVAELKSAHPKMRTFDSVPHLCDESLCHGIMDGRVIYRDDDHLSAVGSKLIAESLLESLEASDSKLSTRISAGSRWAVPGG